MRFLSLCVSLSVIGFYASSGFAVESTNTAPTSVQKSVKKHKKMKKGSVHQQKAVSSSSTDSAIYSSMSSSEKNTSTTQIQNNNLSLLNGTTVGAQIGAGMGSVSFSLPSGVNSPDTSTRTRPMIGVFAEKSINEMIAARTELNYVQRGFTMSETTNLMKLDAAANYLELPLLVKAQTNIDKFTPYVLTGPQLGILVSSGSSLEFQGRTFDSTETNINTFNVAWNLGAGTKVEFSKDFALDLGVRYSKGLTNVAGGETGDSSTKLNSLQFLAGVGIHL